MKFDVVPKALAGLLFLTSPLHAATLSTGAGDGSAVIEVDEFGSSSDAWFDPMGAVGPADTFYESSIYFPSFGRRQATGNSGLEATLISASDTQLVTSFNLGATLSVLLTQTLTDSHDTEGRVTGAVLSQSFAITNIGSQDESFDIIRYLDADLAFDGSLLDSGGILQAGGTRVLFEIEADNVPGSDTTFVGINASVTGDNTSPRALDQNYEMNEYSTLRRDIEAGANLRDRIEGDVDGDGFIDGTYDVTMALQNYVTIPAGGTAVYSTQTLFGNAVPPVPGSLEALPILPTDRSPEGGFSFELLAMDLLPGQTIWIDPVIATGYTYEVTGATFTSVTLPSYGTVPDSDYLLVVDGVTYSVTSGQVVVFAGLTAGPVTSFQILGIDEDLMLDPANPTAFVTGVALDGFTASTVVVTQTPVLTDTDAPSPVPLPAGLWLLLSSFGVFGFVGRAGRRRAA